MTGEAVHPLRTWREAQLPRLTLDAAAAAVGTVRQVWYDWERGRRIPTSRFMTAIFKFTAGEVRPDHFYDLPPIGQMALPFAVPPTPLFDDDANSAVGDGDDRATENEHGGPAETTDLLAAA